MSAYNDDTRLEFLALRDGLEVDLIADGLLFRETEVSLVTVETTGGDPARGKPGTRSTTSVTLSPRPQVELKSQYRNVDGAPVRFGDARVILSRAVAEADIRSASYFDLGGERYSLVEGELRRAPNGLDWIAILKREAQ